MPSNDSYDVLWPLGRVDGAKIEFSRRPDGIDGKTIAELQDLENGTWFPVIRQELRRRFPEVNIIPFNEFGYTHGPEEREVIAALPEALRTRKVDAVISGVGL